MIFRISSDLPSLLVRFYIRFSVHPIHFHIGFAMLSVLFTVRSGEALPHQPEASRPQDLALSCEAKTD